MLPQLFSSLEDLWTPAAVEDESGVYYQVTEDECLDGHVENYTDKSYAQVIPNKHSFSIIIRVTALGTGLVLLLW